MRGEGGSKPNEQKSRFRRDCLKHKGVHVISAYKKGLTVKDVTDLQILLLH